MYQAIKMLIIAIGFPFSMWLMLETFAEGKITENEAVIIYGASLCVSVFLFLVFVIPNLRRKSVFFYEVSDCLVTCKNPGGENYEIEVGSISRILQTKRATGDMWVDDYIETSDGKSYAIPKSYDLNIHNVKKAIALANPSVEMENKVRY